MGVAQLLRLGQTTPDEVASGSLLRGLAPQLRRDHRVHTWKRGSWLPGGRTARPDRSATTTAMPTGMPPEWGRRAPPWHRHPGRNVAVGMAVQTGQGGGGHGGARAELGGLPYKLLYNLLYKLPFNLPLNLLYNLPPPILPGRRSRRSGQVVKGCRTRRLLPCGTPCRTDRPPRVSPSVASWVSSWVPSRVASWVAATSS